METYSKVEIVRRKPSIEDNLTTIFQVLLTMALKVLIVWWAVAAWFPELGITYWQTVLPVFAARELFANSFTVGRRLK